MATDRHQAPSYPLRMPDGLKAKVQEAAEASGRSLHAELLHRIQRSFEGVADPTALDLAPTVVRMERDIAKLEVEKAAETLTIRVVASAMRPLLDSLGDDVVLEGFLEGSTVADWKRLCDAYLKNKIVRKDELDGAFERLKSAEAAVRATLPTAADPIWEQMKSLRATNKSGEMRSRKPKA